MNMNTNLSSDDPNFLNSLVTAGASVATTYIAADAAKTAAKKVTPTNLLLVGGFGVAVLLVLVFAVKHH